MRDMHNASILASSRVWKYKGKGSFEEHSTIIYTRNASDFRIDIPKMGGGGGESIILES